MHLSPFLIEGCNSVQYARASNYREIVLIPAKILCHCVINVRRRGRGRIMRTGDMFAKSSRRVRSNPDDHFQKGISLPPPCVNFTLLKFRKGGFSLDAIVDNIEILTSC